MSCQVKSSHVKSRQVMSCQVMSCQVKSCQVKSSQVKSCQVKSCQVKSSQVMSWNRPILIKITLFQSDLSVDHLVLHHFSNNSIFDLLLYRFSIYFILIVVLLFLFFSCSLFFFLFFFLLVLFLFLFRFIFLLLVFLLVLIVYHPVVRLKTYFVCGTAWPQAFFFFFENLFCLWDSLAAGAFFSWKNVISKKNINI